MEFVPEQSHLVVLTFLALGLGLVLSGVWFLGLLVQGRRQAAVRVLAGMVGAAGIYGGALLASSLASEERVLAPGEKKYFCEVDCHLAYSVEGVQATKTLGRVAARGTFYVVTVKTWFDERTISSRRPRDLALRPEPRIARVVDARGRSFATSLEGQKAVPAAESVPMMQPLRPGESFTTTLVFDLPDDVERPRLQLTTLHPLTSFLIGHENSFLHKRIYFDLAPAGMPAMKQARRPAPRLGAV